MDRILVVDDDISIRMGIREFAEYQGYQVELAANGAEAVRLCREQEFDLIILDIMMPGMDGYQAYKAIRKIRDIPALMLSAKDQEYDKLQGFELGIVALLFWLVLHFSVGIQYQRQVEKELDGAVQSVWEMYGQTDFDTNISFLAGTSSYFIQILSEEGGEPLLSVNSQGESARPQQENIADVKLFERLDASEGFCNYYVEDETHDSQWAVSAVVLANHNGNREVLVISKSMADVDALMDLLTSRYWMITGIVLVLASVISLLLANYFSKPFRHLNKNAVQMAEGNYKTKFVREGPSEASKLSETLELAQEEFNRTEQLRRDFMANISHDMKTPLTVIKMYAEMLEDFSGEIPEKRKEHARKIQEEADRLTEFINDSMELARLQSGTVQLEESVFAMRDVVGEAVSRACAGREDFEFDIFCNRDSAVKGDRRLIERVIYNFVSNAIKYSGPQKRAKVNIRTIQNNVRVEVIDYGIGISKEELDLVWKRFYQVQPHDRKKTGMGIGLNIVSEILDMHYAPYGVESVPGIQGKTRAIWDFLYERF